MQEIKTQSDSLETAVYTPFPYIGASIFSVFKRTIKNALENKELIIVMFRRDFFAIYKKSILGLFWLVLAPLVGLVSWVFMNKTGLLNPGEMSVPYPAYVLIGTLFWNLWTGFVNGGSMTLASGSTFITQVNYPHEILLFKEALQAMATFIINMVLSVIAVIVLGFYPAIEILFVPLLVFPLFFYGVGFGLLMSPFTAVVGDVKKVIDIFMGFILFLTPVYYVFGNASEALRLVNTYNPLSYLVGVPRDIALMGASDHLETYLYISLFSPLFFAICLKFFCITERKVVEKMI